MCIRRFESAHRVSARNARRRRRAPPYHIYNAGVLSVSKGEGGTPALHSVARGRRAARHTQYLDDALDAVLDLLVELLQPLAVLLQEGGHHVAERVRVRFQ